MASTRLVRIALFALLSTSLLACGDDGGSGDPDASASSADAQVGPDATLATVSGIIESADETPLAGVTVSIHGTTMMAVTDANGMYELDAPIGEQLLLLERDTYWGRLQPIDVPISGLADVDLGVFSDADLNDMVSALNRTADAAKGAVAVEFSVPDDGNGEGAALSASSDAPFTFDDQDDTVESDTLVPNGSPVLVFTGVDLGTTGISASGADGQTVCAMDRPGADWPILAKVITVAVATCADL